MGCDPILERFAQRTSVEVFDSVEPNPTDLNVEAGAEKLKELGDAVVVPIGGGSSGCGKSIALLASNRHSRRNARCPAHTCCRSVIAVPTTAGTGSRNKQRLCDYQYPFGRKTYVVHPSVHGISVLDGPHRRTATYPTATCGDVLTHAVDICPLEQMHTQMPLPLRPFVKWPGTCEIVTDGQDIEARSQMLLGSAMAAQAFNVTGLGSAHGTGHAISARLNAAHGQTLATMLPHVMEYNMSVREDKYAEVARIRTFWPRNRCRCN